MDKLLLVEDNEQVADAYMTYLKSTAPGLDIVWARNEKEGAAILKDRDVDVVVTDLDMLHPFGGMEVLKVAKQKDPLIMVILVTATDKLDRYKAFELGAFDCVAKCMPGVETGPELLVKMKSALNFRRLAQAQLTTGQKMGFLQRYFDPRVFALIEQNQELLRMQRKYVTVVFYDIRGFSRLSKTLDAHPEIVAGFLREYFQMASEVIFKHEGVLDKFIGDGVMALFGALDLQDEPAKPHANNAIKASLELKQHFAGLYEQWLRRWVKYSPETIDIGLGCGIHCGEALVGNVGTASRDQFTALGPHVNFTQRIEGRAGKGQTLVSATTKAATEEEFEFKFVEKISNVKNIAGDFDLWEVVGLKKAPWPYQVGVPGAA